MSIVGSGEAGKRWEDEVVTPADVAKAAALLSRAKNSSTDNLSMDRIGSSNKSSKISFNLKKEVSARSLFLYLFVFFMCSLVHLVSLTSLCLFIIFQLSTLLCYRIDVTNNT
jgi:hypothetical protein